MELPTQEHIRGALAVALNPQGALAATFAAELEKALPWMGHDAAMASAQDILFRRRGEQLAPQALPMRLDRYGLPEGKVEEIIVSLAQPHYEMSPPSADALVHIYANIRAQRELHAALASNVFQPRGALDHTLSGLLQQAEPALAAPQAVAASYVEVRRQRAQGVVVALAEGGEVEKQTIALAMRLRRGSDKGQPRSDNQPQAPQGEKPATISSWLQGVMAMLGLQGQSPAAASPPVHTVGQHTARLAAEPQPNSRSLP